MKKRAIWMLFLATVLGGASCRIFKPEIAAYPIGLSFPVVEDASMSFKGRIISPVRERGGAYFYSTENGFVRCVDGLKKQVIWTFEANNGLRTAPFPGRENIYVHDKANVLYCLESQGRALLEEGRGGEGPDPDRRGLRPGLFRHRQGNSLVPGLEGRGSAAVQSRGGRRRRPFGPGFPYHFRVG